MLEDKIREAPFFKVQSGKITLWTPWLSEIRLETFCLIGFTPFQCQTKPNSKETYCIDYSATEMKTLDNLKICKE